VFPFASWQVALNTIVPCPVEVLDAGQFEAVAAVRAAPSVPIPQFQVTVTSVLFQPAPFAAGDWVGTATGGPQAVTVTALS